MRMRILTWICGALGVLLIAGLVLYFTVVGLDKADKLASVIGGIAGLVALGSAAFGMLLEGRSRPSSSNGNNSDVRVRNEISGGGFCGPVFQGDFTGPISLASAAEHRTMHAERSNEETHERRKD